MSKTVFELTQTYQSTDEEQRRRLIQQKSDQYIRARMQSGGRAVYGHD